VRHAAAETADGGAGGAEREVLTDYIRRIHWRCVAPVSAAEAEATPTPKDAVQVGQGLRIPLSEAHSAVGLQIGLQL